MPKDASFIFRSAPFVSFICCFSLFFV
ncbi:hypothetical protein [Ferroplasma acidiphilum]